MESLDDNLINDNESGLVLKNESLKFLAEIGRWCRLLSILGFAGIGFMILLSFAIGSIDTGEYGLPIAGGILAIMYTIMAAIGFFPVLFLYRFSMRLKIAISNRNSEELNLAFMNLKSHYKFIGIISIALIIFYLVAMAFGLGSAMLGAI